MSVLSSTTETGSADTTAVRAPLIAGRRGIGEAILVKLFVVLPVGLGNPIAPLIWTVPGTGCGS